jgi:hypothetical protein
VRSAREVTDETELAYELMSDYRTSDRLLRQPASPRLAVGRRKQVTIVEAPAAGQKSRACTATMTLLVDQGNPETNVLAFQPAAVAEPRKMTGRSVLGQPRETGNRASPEALTRGERGNYKHQLVTPGDQRTGANRTPGRRGAQAPWIRWRYTGSHTPTAWPIC